MAGKTPLLKLRTIFNQSISFNPHLVNASKVEIEFSQYGHNRVHNWTNYIRGDILEMWEELSEEAKLVAAIMAEEQAENEEWE